MAAKSDFAQKLLHDLRIRKERMGASQSSSARSTTTRDAYRNPGSVQRGSRHTKSLESIGGPKTANQQHIMSSRGSTRTPSINESSQQIVSYTGGRHDRSQSIGDLSMAFTYEVKNGGKLMNVDFSGSSSNTNTMINFLHQIGRRSLDVGNTRTNVSNSLVKHRPGGGAGGAVTLPPALTTIQIKEISKGVQNLYEILRSSSNGVNVDRYSMEVGKELLKGAKGLEESLRMLVNLQEASELMVSPKRKSRITLLEVDNDDRDDHDHRPKIKDQNQIALPRFSFDKPSRKPNLALTDGTSKLPTQRSESVSSTKNGSSRSEKGRISNVIAKLMGLDEVPGKLDSNSKQSEVKTNGESRLIQVNKASKPELDRLVSLHDPKDSNTNTKQSNNKRSDQVPKKPTEKQSDSETKAKMQPRPKRRSAVVVADLRQERVDRKKTTRTEIKLVPRNNQIQELEKVTQKTKQDPPKIKQVQQNPKPKDATSKGQEFERTPLVAKEKPMIRKKLVDSMVLRTKDEVLKRTKKPLNSNFETQSKHKLSVFKETKRKDSQPLVPIRPKPEDTNQKTSNFKISQPVIQLDAIITNKLTQETSDLVVANKHPISSERIIETKQKKAAFYSNIQVVLTENEKQLKEILIKDQLFLSTAESLFKLNIPVGFLHVDDHNHHDEKTKLKLDCGYEILKRKARSQELSSHPYTKPSVGAKPIRFLDELVKQLYKDLESLRLYGRNALNEDDEADYLHHMLERDIHNENADINSFWDFGWHTTTFTFVEKDEFVNGVAQDVFYGLVDEIVDDLLSIVVRF